MAFISNPCICITSSVANEKQHMHFLKCQVSTQIRCKSWRPNCTVTKTPHLLDVISTPPPRPHPPSRCVFASPGRGSGSPTPPHGPSWEPRWPGQTHMNTKGFLPLFEKKVGWGVGASCSLELSVGMRYENIGTDNLRIR